MHASEIARGLNLDAATLGPRTAVFVRLSRKVLKYCNNGVHTEARQAGYAVSARRIQFYKTNSYCTFFRLATIAARLWRGRHMRISRVTLCAVVLLGTGGIANAACAKFHQYQDGKRVTVTGTITKIEKTPGRNVAIEVDSCDGFFISTLPTRSCQIGKHIRASGKLSYCDDYDFDEMWCSADMVEAKTVSCR
jgi:hypothetical protein